MKIAIIEHKNYEYIINVFQKHDYFAKNDCYFVIDDLELNTKCFGTAISFEELFQINADAILIAVSSNRKLSKLLITLHNHGIKNVYIVRQFALEMKQDFIGDLTFNTDYVDFIPNLRQQPYLPHIETHVCDHCNLNCKGCNHFSPFVTDPRVTDIIEYEEEMKRLKELFFNIGRIYLLGGEPLLEPKLCCEMIAVTRNYFPKSEIRILTNATLLNQMENEFWNCIRNHNVIIHITVYYPLLKSIKELQKLLNEKRVHYIFARQMKYFYKHWTLFPMEDPEYNCFHCSSAGCHYLGEGYISKCPDGMLMANMASRLNCTSDELRDNSRILLSNADDGWSIICQLDKPCEMCGRCTITRMQKIPWEVSGPQADIYDWIIK